MVYIFLSCQFQLNNNGTGIEDLLNYIVTPNHNKHCTSSEKPTVAFVPIRTRRFHLIQEKVDLVSRVIKDYGTTKAKRKILFFILHLKNTSSYHNVNYEWSF